MKNRNTFEPTTNWSYVNIPLYVVKLYDDYTEDGTIYGVRMRKDPGENRTSTMQMTMDDFVNTVPGFECYTNLGDDLGKNQFGSETKTMKLR